jgi:alpha-D-ribose 1-methylphosphonate 5-triphosphate synthase subunit PhnG
MATSPLHQGPDEIAARRAVMALCADASRDDLDAALRTLEAPPIEDLRPPETGLVMATGRIGGDGRPFNLGEVSVTRAAIRLPDGATGFAYHLGRDRAKARLAAALDAAVSAEAARQQAARRTAATRVDFLTLARGED